MENANAHGCYRVVQVKNLNNRNHFIQTWLSSWVEQGYVKPDENIIEKYSRYDLFSADFLLLKENKATGTLRIVNQNSAIGLPVLNDFTVERKFNKEEKLCEATLLTVIASERRADNFATFLLLIELWRYARTNNISGILIAADIRLWFLLTRVFKLCFTAIGKRKMYEGSVTIPAYLNIEEQKKKAMKLSPRNIMEEAFQKI